MSIMLIGIDFYPQQTPSDKNYWLSIIEEIKKDFKKIQIISFVKRKPIKRHEEYDKVAFHYFRFLHFLSPYSPMTGFFARLIVILVNLLNINRIIRQNEIKVIHFIDNFGIAMPVLKFLNKNTKITFSLSTSRTANTLYNLILRASCSNLDMVVVFTEVLRQRLSSIGINPQKIEVIKWGVNVPLESPGLPHSPATRLILWTGFLTQVWEEDFFLAIRIARKILKENDKCRFVFCFKPHSFNNKYKKYEDKGIEIQPGNFSFDQLVSSSDIYFCPIKNKNKIIAPPLTWIEMMSYGKPIITTSVKGAHEIIENGKNGYICDDELEIVDNLLLLVNNHDQYREMSQYAKESIKKNFNFRLSYQKYSKLWRNMHGQGLCERKLSVEK